VRCDTSYYNESRQVRHIPPKSLIFRDGGSNKLGSYDGIIVAYNELSSYDGIIINVLTERQQEH
jgi:hypothetical protein